MNLSDLANASQIIAAVGVVISIGYLAVQIRGNTKVVSAQARYGLSEFALRFSIFRAEHADRFAKLESGVELTDGDCVFRSLEPCSIAAPCRDLFSSSPIGLIPHAHWRRYAQYMTKYIRRIQGSLDDMGPGFSEDFARWLDELLASVPQKLSKTNDPAPA